MNNIIEKIQKEAPDGLVIITPGPPGNTEYTEKRKVANLRFNYMPSGIALCTDYKHVAYCINCCNKPDGPKLRIRSGGHQHEGMSAADDVLIIDLSGFNKIDYKEDNGIQYAWIGVGNKLADVYSHLEENEQMVIPGGLCASVNVGGLTSGVGWGTFSRRFGYTCDSVVEAEVVTAKGEFITASKDENKDLFWAIRGGGGGNFGVVTRFKFQLHSLGRKITRFSLRYHTDDTLVVAQKWAKFQLDLNSDNDLTIGGRLFREDNHTASISINGLYCGSLEDAKASLSPFLEEPAPTREQYTVNNYPDTSNPMKGTASGPTNHVLETMNYLGDLISPSSTPDLPTAPTSTCEGKYYHKITSAFPKDNEPDTVNKLMEDAVNYMKRTPYKKELNAYVSLQGLGGKMQTEPEGGTAYPFRDKPFMFKIQAWWAFDAKEKNKEEKEKKYLDWIRDYQIAIADSIDGAFINFQDKDLIRNSNFLQGKLQLLEQYYKGNLPRLREIKSKYDPNNLFDFGMSIPPE